MLAAYKRIIVPINIDKDITCIISGADNAFMLVNGSTFGVQTMILSACSPKDKIIIPRNVHKSVINAIILSGATPIFIQPEIDYNYGIANGVKVETVKETIKAHPDAKAIFLINPTYFGVASDLRKIIKICHRQQHCCFSR